MQPHRVKARKPHVCDWCGKRIEVGEWHIASTNVSDGIYTWRECDRCKPYVSEMMGEPDEFYFDSIADGYTSESFTEFMRDEHPDVLDDWRAK
jgi:hypothetical protein